MGTICWPVWNDLFLYFYFKIQYWQNNNTMFLPFLSQFLWSVMYSAAWFVRGASMLARIYSGSTHVGADLFGEHPCWLWCFPRAPMLALICLGGALVDSDLFGGVLVYLFSCCCSNLFIWFVQEMPLFALICSGGTSVGFD